MTWSRRSRSTVCAGSTDNADVAFDPERRYALHPQVALRSEPFGALAYHYGNRRLIFIRSASLVELVRGLDRHP
ncbi:MAG TPA: mycofactocin biosynthesis chaperone MftB, partial [Actinomycetota bacterium]|nr:mycofactocin biosynthesis chaperone MftB [Actinomycetota bacterium]